MNSVLDMYCKCSYLHEAYRFFHGMMQRTLVTWNTLIAGYEKADSRVSLYLFSRMELEGFTPNCFTYASVIAACANLALLSCGQQIHGGILQRGFDGNLVVSNALIAMYGKCGSISDSDRIFSEMSSKDLVSWTSMMNSYGSHGYGNEAVELLDKMVSSGTRPDCMVFVAVLSACSHAGLVDEGLRCFKSMIGDYNIIPDKEVYGCVVDLLGRAGRLFEAYELISTMPYKPDESVWGSFLGACKAHKHPNLAKLAVPRLLDSRPSKRGTYATLSNIYAANGKWEEFAEMRTLLRGLANRKETGRSWVEVRNEVISFVRGNHVNSHHTASACKVLELLVPHMKEVENVPDLDCLMHDMEDGT